MGMTPSDRHQQTCAVHFSLDSRHWRQSWWSTPTVARFCWTSARCWVHTETTNHRPQYWNYQSQATIWSTFQHDSELQVYTVIKKNALFCLWHNFVKRRSILIILSLLRLSSICTQMWNCICRITEIMLLHYLVKCTQRILHVKPLTLCTKKTADFIQLDL